MNKALIPKETSDREYRVVVVKHDGKYYLKTLDDQRVFEMPESGRIDDLAFPSDKELVLIQYDEGMFDFEFETTILPTLFHIRKEENIESTDALKIVATEAEKQQILTDYKTHRNKFTLGLLNLYNSFIRNPSSFSTKKPNATVQITSLKYILLPILLGIKQKYWEFIIYTTETGNIISGRIQNCMMIDNIFCKIFETSSKTILSEDKNIPIHQYFLRFNYNKKEYQGHQNIGSEEFDKIPHFKYIFDIKTIENIDCSRNPNRPIHNAMGQESFAYHHMDRQNFNGGSLLRKSRKTQKRHKKTGKSRNQTLTGHRATHGK